MASLIPARISQVLTGQAVKNPAIMPICIKNQYTGLSGRRCGAGKNTKYISGAGERDGQREPGQARQPGGRHGNKAFRVLGGNATRRGYPDTTPPKPAARTAAGAGCAPGSGAG